jgi:hypothetical protein
MDTHEQKQAAVAAFSPLQDAGILQQVFTFLPAITSSLVLSAESGTRSMQACQISKCAACI